MTAARDLAFAWSTRTSDVIEDLLLAAVPTRVVVAATGDSPAVRTLIAGARRLEATVEFAGPDDVDDLGGEVRRLPAPGLVGLAAAQNPDLAFVSLDPNFYTTARALELLVLSAEVDGAQPPIFIVARATSERDVFVTPEAVPPAHRGDLSGGTVDVDGRPATVSSGRGVHGAIDDFLALPGWRGWTVADSHVAVLVPEGSSRRNAALDAALTRMADARVLVAWMQVSHEDIPGSLRELGRSLVERPPGSREPDLGADAGTRSLDQLVERVTDGAEANRAAAARALDLVSRALDDAEEAVTRAGRSAATAREQAAEAERDEGRLRRHVAVLKERQDELKQVLTEAQQLRDGFRGGAGVDSPVRAGAGALEAALARAEEAQRRADRAGDERRQVEAEDAATRGRTASELDHAR